MPVTRNVAWDGRLESYKGRDATRYVSTAAALATTCAVCGRPLHPDEPLSLIVDITESTAPDGTEYVTFSDYLSHRRCSAPELTVNRAPWKPADLTPLAARMLLTQETAGSGSPGIIEAALVYTLVPVVSFREAGGELTSALVSILLSHGFCLALDSGYTEILDQAGEVEDSCAMTITDAGFVTLTIAGESIFSEQLDPENPDDAEWLAVAVKGKVLIISGDNLVITDTRIDVDTAARMGTLVIGYVPVRP
jgi:hypothetical protein